MARAVKILCAVLAVAVAAGLPGPHRAAAQLRIVDYNIAENYDIATDSGGLNQIFAAIGAEVRNGFSKPIDVLAVQESHESGSDAVLLAAKLNTVFGVSTYQPAPVPFNAMTQGNGLPGLVYNSATVSLIGAPLAFGNVSTTEQPRSTLRYQLRPVNYGAPADFYLYNSHYKSDEGTDNQQRRNLEAQSIRANADALGEGVHAIYAGDFNVYRDTEPMYQTLLAAGPGRAEDPINRPGNWSAPSFGQTFKDIHTQTPATTSAFDNQVILGGMDDRFDFQLVTSELVDGEGLSYLSGSYHAFGNNGSHEYGEAITTGSGATMTLLTALARSSDHLPVVADYQLPARMNVQFGSYPTMASVGAAIPIDVLVQNVAASLTVGGADELDYAISVMGDLVGGLSGTDFALGGGNAHQVMFNTATPGTKTGMITVTALSQATATPLATLPVSFTVSGEGGTSIPPPPLPPSTPSPTRTTIARDNFDAPLNRIGFTQTPAPGAYSSAVRGFERYQVGVSATIPFDLIDQTTTGSPTDTFGIIVPTTKTDGWFGVADTLDGTDNPSGNADATWQFNVSGATSLEASIDMGAVGDFEAGADVFNWTYAIDGGAFAPLFTSSVNETGAKTYTFAGGNMATHQDPLSMTALSGPPVELSNVLQTFTSALAGAGSVLTLRLHANTNGENEGYVFDNILVTGFRPVLASDFNRDGAVDAADLAAWRGGFGMTAGAAKAHGDADNDGDVDNADFSFWQRQLGQSPAGWAASIAAPEPPAAALIAIAGAWAAVGEVGRGRRRDCKRRRCPRPAIKSIA